MEVWTMFSRQAASRRRAKKSSQSPRSVAEAERIAAATVTTCIEAGTGARAESAIAIASTWRT
eukprot:4769750-Pyramimonas_sp.AAC.1